MRSLTEWKMLLRDAPDTAIRDEVRRRRRLDSAKQEVEVARVEFEQAKQRLDEVNRILACDGEETPVPANEFGSRRL